MAYSIIVQIVRTGRYVKDMKRIGATASDMARLEAAIAARPTAGDLIVGLRGIRKIRFGVGGRGKSGGGRAIYFIMMAEAVVMLMAYAKSEQADLTPAQRRTVLTLLEEITDGG